MQKICKFFKNSYELSPVAASMLGVVSAIIRKAAFVIVLCSWFTIMNIYALIQLIGALV